MTFEFGKAYHVVWSEAPVEFAWFAWRPVVVRVNSSGIKVWAWLQYVIATGLPTGHDDWDWKYKLPNKETPL